MMGRVRSLQVVMQFVVLLLDLPVHRAHQVFVAPLKGPAGPIFELLHPEGANLDLVLGDKILDPPKLIICVLFVFFDLFIFGAVLVLELLDEGLELVGLGGQLRLVPLLKVQPINSNFLQVLPQTHLLVYVSIPLLQLLAA
jgi:hypothetical protein